MNNDEKAIEKIWDEVQSIHIWLDELLIIKPHRKEYWKDWVDMESEVYKAEGRIESMKNKLSPDSQFTVGALLNDYFKMHFGINFGEWEKLLD